MVLTIPSNEVPLWLAVLLGLIVLAGLVVLLLLLCHRESWAGTTPTLV